MERPILFSGPMVRAILEDRKTQTRRVVTLKTGRPGSAPREYWEKHADWASAWADRGFGAGEYLHVPCHSTEDSCCPRCDEMGWTETSHRFRPRIEIGDGLWVRETFCVESNFNLAHEDEYPPPWADGRPVKRHQDAEFDDYWEQCHYRATDPPPELAYPDTPDATCRWRPSIFMPRWACRLELRVTAVRVERLQDIGSDDAVAEGVLRTAWPKSEGVPGPVERFSVLWDSINAKRGYAWATNPWVWAVTFERTAIHRRDTEDAENGPEGSQRKET